MIGGQDVVGNGQRAGIQDAATPVTPSVRNTRLNLAVGDGQASDRDGEPLANVKDPELIVAADDQQASAGPLDVQAVVDRQLAASQRDGLAVQAGSKDDRVAALGGFDRVPQRPSPTIKIIRDRQRTRNGAVFEEFKPRQE